MNEMELQLTLVSMMPIIKMREENGRYYYMLGTEVKEIMIKTDRLFLRVGGGYVTLQEYIEQNGAFECIKIYKCMRDKKCPFKEAVKFFMEKNKGNRKLISQYMESNENSQVELFETTIDLLKEKQNEVARQRGRAGSMKTLNNRPAA